MNFNKLIPEMDVINIDETKKFYLMLGFVIEYERLNDKFVFMSYKGSQFMFQEVNLNDLEHEKWEVAPLEYPFGRDELDILYNKLKENNYPIKYDIEENHYEENGNMLMQKEFLVQDPNGYLLRFNQEIS